MENRQPDHSVTRPDVEGHSPFRIAQIIGLCPSSIVSEIQMKIDATFLKLDVSVLRRKRVKTLHSWARYLELF
jgi:hypothetical protein